jgi:hypothetical protein
VFENGVLRRIFGSRRDWVTRVWWKLYEEFYVHSPKIIRVIKKISWAWHIVCAEESRGAHMVLM